MSQARKNWSRLTTKPMPQTTRPTSPMTSARERGASMSAGGGKVGVTVTGPPALGPRRRAPGEVDRDPRGARRGQHRPHPGRLAVREERARFERVVSRGLMHVLATGGERDAGGRERQDAGENGATAQLRRLPADEGP